MAKKDRRIITISASLHTIGTLIITLGLLRQFDIRIFEFLFNTPIEVGVSGGLVTIGLLFTLTAFWIQFLLPRFRGLLN